MTSTNNVKLIVKLFIICKMQYIAIHVKLHFYIFTMNTYLSHRKLTSSRTKTQTMALHATFFSTTPFQLGVGTPQCVYKLGYGLGEPGFEYRQKHEMFLSSKRSTGSGTYPASYWMDTEVLSRGKSGRGVKSTTRVKNEWSYSSTSPIRLHGKARDDRIFYLVKTTPPT